MAELKVDRKGAGEAGEGTVQKITPFIWFDDKAEEAVAFYVSVFQNSRIKRVTRFGDEVPGPKGKVMTLDFELEGQEFMALNGGPGVFTLTGAISFFVKCETQLEVDHLWNTLSEGGKPSRCGWLTDRYGVTWQIIPAVLGELMSDPDPAKSKRVVQAMLQMDKLSIAGLREAYEREE